MAAKVSQYRGWLQQDELDRICALLQRFQLPITAPDDMHINDFMPYMKTDKKVRAGQMRFVLPTAFGYSEVIDDVNDSELQSIFT